MTKPTAWQSLAERGIPEQGYQWEHHVGTDTVHYDGAACYIIGIRKKGDHKIRTVYVGETENLLKRMYEHGSGHSNIDDYIETCTQRGYRVWFRYFKTTTKGKAKRMQDHFLEKWWHYPWNVIGMPY
ncbi:MAG TPA: hypothetical protein VGR53_06930 [Nitrososphaerales archaeon]|nr:hypothetical protein [Nitrososphaerales archaeon]